MTEHQLPPNFQVEEGAPRGTREAFADLTAIIMEHPDRAPGVFESLGNRPEDIRLSAEKAIADETTDQYKLRLAVACGSLLREEMDIEVDMGPSVDHDTRRAAERGVDRDQRRVLRLGSFIKYTGIWAQTLPGYAQPVDGAKAA